MLKDKGSGHLTARAGGNAYRPRLAPEFAAVIRLLTRLVLPLVNHLVEQGVYRFVPPISPDVSPAYDDLGAPAGLATPYIMTEPAFHPPRYADGDRRELAAESRRVEVDVMLHQLADQRDVRGVCPLDRPASWLRPDNRGFRAHIEIQCELELCLRAAYQSAERSKQR